MNGSQVQALIAPLDRAELAAEKERAPKLAKAYDAAVAAKATAETAQAQTEAAKATAEAAQAEAEAAQAQAEEALAALQTAAGALTTALEAEGATIAGCAEQIAAVKVLLPAAE